jgi:hypothetical protein
MLTKRTPRTMSTRLIWLRIAGDAIQFLALCFRSRTSLAAENLFLRKQLAFYQERKLRPRRANNPTRLTMVSLSRHFDWRNALTVVKPKTFLAWHHKGFREPLGLHFWFFGTKTCLRLNALPACLRSATAAFHRT